MSKLFGKGWKTVTGALIWALAHAGVVAAAVELVKPGAGQGVAETAAKIGAALAAVGLAQKAQRVDDAVAKAGK